jgi:hypothetical protein
MLTKCGFQFQLVQPIVQLIGVRFLRIPIFFQLRQFSFFFGSGRFRLEEFLPVDFLVHLPNEINGLLGVFLQPFGIPLQPFLCS